MKIKFIKEYRAIPLSGGIDNDWGCYKDEVKDTHDDQGQWLIDNGFAEEVKEPEWVRKQIKRIEFRIPDGKNWAGNDYVVIEWRYIKDYYYMDSEWGVAMCYKKGLTSRYDVENVDEHDDAGSKSRAAADKRLINLANQLVRDGYIEIEDNPNIVWEDEDEQ